VGVLIYVCANREGLSIFNDHGDENHFKKFSFMCNFYLIREDSFGVTWLRSRLPLKRGTTAGIDKAIRLHSSLFVFNKPKVFSLP
jgi:hypothetical protein